MWTDLKAKALAWYTAKETEVWVAAGIVIAALTGYVLGKL